MIKFTLYWLILLLSVFLSPSYAVDMSNPESDVQGYCSESASLSGIEDSEEKAQFIRICMENLGATVEASEQSD